MIPLDYEQTVLNLHPRSYWPCGFDVASIARDFRGGVNLATTGTPLTGQPGPMPSGGVGGAASLSSSNYFSNPSSVYKFPGVLPFSVAVWAKPAASGQVAVISCRDLDVADGWEISVNAGVWTFTRFFNSGGQSAAINSSATGPGEWHFAVGAYDGTNIYFWLDGSVQGAETLSTSMVDTAADLLLGTNISNQGLNGLLAGAAIFDRALMTEEVRQLWLAAQGGRRLSRMSVAAGGFKSAWRILRQGRRAA